MKITKKIGLVKNNKNKIFFICLIFILLISFIFVFELAIAGSEETGSEVIEIENPVGAGTFTELITKIIKFLIVIFSPIATIMVLYAGLLFMTSGGSTEKIHKAKQTLTWAVIGTAILLIAEGISVTIESFLQ